MIFNQLSNWLNSSSITLNKRFNCMSHHDAWSALAVSRLVQLLLLLLLDIINYKEKTMHGKTRL